MQFQLKKCALADKCCLIHSLLSTSVRPSVTLFSHTTFTNNMQMQFKVNKTMSQTASLFYVRSHLVGLSAVLAALRLFLTMTHISTNATSVSTSSSRCTATCHCCTRSFVWTLCCLRLVCPTTRPSASSSSSFGPAKSQKQGGMKG